VKSGLVADRQLATMGEEQVLHLLLAPGFSTAQTVGRLSGRGVGLDVVRKKVEDLGGTVAISTHSRGAGAAFHLTVPVSLLSTRGLLVDGGGSICALPIDYVARTLRLRRDRIEQVDGSLAVAQEDSEPLRIRFLSSILGRTQATRAEKLSAVVVSRGGAELGIVVDRVLGEQEFVTKRLPWNLRSVAGVNGAVVLGDGRLAVVLDVPHIFASGAGAAEETDPACAAVESTAKETVLVVDDSLTSRTLERNILTRSGYEVIVAVDGEEAWNLLQKHPVDLVVTDIQMPKIDGFELTRRIRSDAGLKNLPVILVTGLGSPRDLAEGAEVGADEYIVKGQFDQRKLLEAVARLT
jgi:two-component system chemotaxis sensor kinase CheA